MIENRHGTLPIRRGLRAAAAGSIRLQRDVVMQQAEQALGPLPCDSLRALDDLGLSDREIARYFSIAPEAVRRLRMRYGLFRAGGRDGQRAC